MNDTFIVMIKICQYALKQYVPFYYKALLLSSEKAFKVAI